MIIFGGKKGEEISNQQKDYQEIAQGGEKTNSV